MKFKYITIALLSICIIMFTLNSCKKEDTARVSVKPTILNYIASDENLSILNAALKRAGMDKDSSFSSGGPYTFFAPVDSAFINAGLNLAKINSYNPAALALILKYHVVLGRISSTSLIGFFTQENETLNPAFNPTITKNYFGIFFNGIPLVKANIELGDGVVHEIGRLAIPPAGNLLQVIKGMPNLSFFSALVESTIGFKDYLILTTPQPVYAAASTVLVPTDDAFKAYGYPDISSINNESLEIREALLQSAIISGKQYTSDLRGGKVISINGYSGNLVLYTKGSSGIGLFMDYQSQPDGFSFKTIGNIIPPRIIQPDTLATNGVIHVLDQVIKTY